VWLTNGVSARRALPGEEWPKRGLQRPK
jgi:hypothetical protein